MNIKPLNILIENLVNFEWKYSNHVHGLLHPSQIGSSLSINNSSCRNLVRVTKSSQLESVDPSQGNNATYLGKVGKDFEFSHLSNRVDIAESSANTGDDDTPADIKTLQDWISKL